MTLFLLLVWVGIFSTGCIGNKEEKEDVPVADFKNESVTPTPVSNNVSTAAKSQQPAKPKMVTYDVVAAGRSDPFAPRAELDAYAKARSSAIAEANARNAEVERLRKLKGQSIKEADDINPYNPDFQNESEFKRSDQFASTAFLDFQVTEGYQFAGMVRDNGDGVYGEGDEQVRRREEDGNFTAVYDPTEYYDGNSTTSLAAAQEALEQLEKPTDYIFAVFTKGDIGRVTPECSSFYGSDMGKVIGSKLDNAPGEEVTFTAVPDAHYHFVKWTNDKGEDVSTVNPLTVTVEGGRLFLANFAKGDPEGISDIDYSVRNDNRFFDLQGRQVAVPRKGVFVRGGKKVVVK